MRRVVPILISLALLSGATSAHAATRGHVQRVTVLQVLGHGHTLRVVNAHHAVRSYAYARRLSRKVRPGSRLGLTVRGRRVYHLILRSRARTVRFYARVTKVGAGSVMLRLADGRGFRLFAHGHRHGPRRTASRRARRARADSISALRTGQTVLASVQTSTIDRVGGDEDGSGPERVGSGSATGADAPASDSTVTGTVISADTGKLVLQSADGATHTLMASAPLLDEADPQVCDLVDVAYHAQHGSLQADDIQIVDHVESGACAPGAAARATEDQLVDGTVSALAPDSSSFTLSTAAGDMTFAPADDTVLSGVSVGDAVTVAYSTSGSTLTADDVQLEGPVAGDTGSGPSGSADAMPSSDPPAATDAGGGPTSSTAVPSGPSGSSSGSTTSAAGVLDRGLLAHRLAVVR